MAMIPAWFVACAITFDDVHTISATAYPSGGFLAKHQLSCWLATLSQDCAGPSGFAVGIAWYTQALVGRWRPEAGWMDGLGRVLGGIWIIMATARVLRSMAF